MAKQALHLALGALLLMGTLLCLSFAAPSEGRDRHTLFYEPASLGSSSSSRSSLPSSSSSSPSLSSSALKFASSSSFSRSSPAVNSIVSKLTCEVCKTGTAFVQFLVATNSSHEDIVEAAVGICTRFHIESERVCKGIVPAFAPEILTVLENLVLSPDEVCGLLLGPECGDTYNPLDTWNVTFPDVPQPAPVPPTPPKPGSPTVRILHLSDTHYDAQYKVGSNANCGEPLCCRDTDGIPEIELTTIRPLNTEEVEL